MASNGTKHWLCIGFTIKVYASVVRPSKTWDSPSPMTSAQPIGVPMLFCNCTIEMPLNWFT